MMSDRSAAGIFRPDNFTKMLCRSIGIECATNSHVRLLTVVIERKCAARKVIIKPFPDNEIPAGNRLASYDEVGQSHIGECLFLLVLFVISASMCIVQRHIGIPIFI